MASRWYVPAPHWFPGGKQTGNGRVRLFAVGWVRLGRGHFVLLWAHVGIICGRGVYVLRIIYSQYARAYLHPHMR